MKNSTFIEKLIQKYFKLFFSNADLKCILSGGEGGIKTFELRALIFVVI